MPSYVKFETPNDLLPRVLEMLSLAKDKGKIKKGVNECTKAIERKSALLIVIAEDVQPEEIVVHIPTLCEEKGIPYCYVKTRKDLGQACGMKVPTSSIAVENAGGAAETLQDIIKRLPKAKSAEPAKAEAPKEEKKEAPKKPAKKAAPKKEAKPAEKKEAPKEEKKEAPKKEEKK